MNFTRIYTKNRSMSQITARAMDSGKIELTMQRWSPSGRRLIFNQSQWSVQAAKMLFSDRCIELERRGWVRQEEEEGGEVSSGSSAG